MYCKMLIKHKKIIFQQHQLIVNIEKVLMGRVMMGSKNNKKIYAVAVG